MTIDLAQVDLADAAAGAAACEPRPADADRGADRRMKQRLGDAGPPPSNALGRPVLPIWVGEESV
jgi:hypothetical protein